jgi:hypothetical protein
MPWKEALFAWIRESWSWRYGRMLKSAVKRAGRRAWKNWKPALAAWRESIVTQARQTTSKLRGSIRQLWADIRSRIDSQ